MRNSRVGLVDRDKDGRNYVSHSPQPYSKYKLQPNKNALMVYGQKGNNAVDAYNNSGGSGSKELAGLGQ